MPQARGTALPDGSLHDGIFECGDVGGAITGNHVDVFIGEALSDTDANARNPFAFVQSRPDATFQAYVLP